MAPDALDEVRGCLDDSQKRAERRRCREGKCSLRLKEVGDFLLIKGDLVRSDVKMCDCIIFLQTPAPTLVLAELKAKTVHAREVGEKMRNAVGTLADLIARCPSLGTCSRFLALALAKGWTRSELKMLAQEHVTFAGNKHRIRHARCGARLSELLQKFLPESQLVRRARRATDRGSR